MPSEGIPPNVKREVKHSQCPNCGIFTKGPLSEEKPPRQYPAPPNGPLVAAVGREGTAYFSADEAMEAEGIDVDSPNAKQEDVEEYGVSNGGLCPACMEDWMRQMEERREQNKAGG